MRRLRDSARLVPSLALTLTLAAAPVTAQHDCGTRITDEIRAHAQASALLTTSAAARASSEAYVVPLALHVVRRSDGTGGIPFAQLQQGLRDLDAAFAPANIRFCVPHPVDYIDDDFFHGGMTESFQVDALRAVNVVPDAINIYCVETFAVSGTIQLCGLSSYPVQGVQGVVMRNSCLGVPSNPSTFPHEIGHYFHLYHTHDAPVHPECVNGSNCTFAGDFVCDTPADPRLDESTVDPVTCAYTGNATGPCSGLPYAPLTDNLMSFSRKTCRTSFTPGQIARMRASLREERAELIAAGCEVGVESLCLPAFPNSTGTFGLTRVAGSTAVADNAFGLRTTDLPPGSFGYYVVGTLFQVSGPAGASGFLCVGGPTGRFIGPGQVLTVDASGEVELSIDLTSVPTPTGPESLAPGDVRIFQFWHRDLGWMGPTSIFSTALRVEFR